MKNLITALFFCVLAFSAISQNAIKKTLFTDVELIPAPPSSIKEGSQLGENCKFETSIASAYYTRRHAYEAQFKNVNPNDILKDMNINPNNIDPNAVMADPMAYTQNAIPPSTDEVQLMGTLITTITDWNSYISGVSYDFGAKHSSIEKKIANFDSIASEKIKKCPALGNGSYSPECVKEIVNNLANEIEKATTDFVEQSAGVLNSIKSKLKATFAAPENQIAMINYGEKSNLALKSQIWSFQSNVIEIVGSYADFVGSVWERTCENNKRVNSLRSDPLQLSR